MWISGKDRAGALEFTLLMNGPDGHDEIRPPSSYPPSVSKPR